MKTSTAHSRLESLQLAAEECLTRDEAQKILKRLIRPTPSSSLPQPPSTVPRIERPLKPVGDEDLTCLVVSRSVCIHSKLLKSCQEELAEAEGKVEKLRLEDVE